MRKRLVLVALLAAVTLMLGLVGCSSGDAAGGKAQEDVEGLPARAAEDVGGFESYGDVSFAHYDGGADGVAAIVVQQAHCENDDLVYSVGIAEDGRLVGFRIS